MTDRFVEPDVHLVGYTATNMSGILEYLEKSGNLEFREALKKAEHEGVQPAETLISMYAKLCYASLSVGNNANITQVRDIKGNLKGIFDHAHGSVLEHVTVNFIIRNCSRVFTHELVRHRVGSAYSQTSGRYCRIDIGGLKVVWDPILDGCEEEAEAVLLAIEKGIYLMECKKGLREPPEAHPSADELDCFYANGPGIWVDHIVQVHKMWVPKAKGVNFARKKKLTSAFRRFAPNGQTNEIGASLNIRTLRHTILMRTSRHSEWEIRKVFEKIYFMVREKFPLLFADAKEEVVEGIVEVTGMRMAPYDRELKDFSFAELQAEMDRRAEAVEGKPEPKGSGAEEYVPNTDKA